MHELKEFIKNDVRSFVRNQRLQAGLSANSRFFGYTLEDFESRAEQIPACDFFKIIKAIASDEEISRWYLNNQFKILQLQNNKRHLYLNRISV